jgi:hypothetical protein
MAYTIKSGAVLSPYLRRQAQALADRLPFDIVITSGNRNVRQQAQAMFGKIELGEDLVDTYRNDDMAQAVQDTYPDLDAAVAVLEEHPGASKHMQNRALDVRTYDRTTAQVNQMVQAADSMGWFYLVEAQPAHLHLGLPAESGSTAGGKKNNGPGLGAVVIAGAALWILMR